MNDFEKKCKVVENDILGRHVVASYNLKAGETVLLEHALLVMPANGDRRCANCWKLATKFCNKCQIFSLCADCETHKEFDCQFFANAKERNTNFQIEELQKQHANVLGLLQLLLLRGDAATRPQYDALLQCEAHLAERRKTPLWQELQEKSITPIKNSGVLNLLAEERGELEQNDDEWLHRLLGISDVNAFEMRAPDKSALRGIFPNAQILSHSCVANTIVAIDDNYNLKIYTNRDVQADETLHHCYANSLLGTVERHDMLLIGKYFHCNCERCADPTEFGSHLSSLVCQPCAAQQKQQSPEHESYVVYKSDEQKWKCLKCDHQMPAATANSILERAHEEAYHASGDLRHMELLLAKLGQMLHRNHYIMLDLKQNIAAILRTILMRAHERPGERVYQRKVQLCQEILIVLKAIQPGISRLRAIALYELSSTQAELGRLRYAEKQLSVDELLQVLHQSESMLREAIRMLLYEPPQTPEGRAAKDMLHQLKELQHDIQMLN